MNTFIEIEVTEEKLKEAKEQLFYLEKLNIKSLLPSNRLRIKNEIAGLKKDVEILSIKLNNLQMEIY